MFRFLDQTPSPANLKKILDKENRKGHGYEQYFFEQIYSNYKQKVQNIKEDYNNQKSQPNLDEKQQEDIKQQYFEKRHILRKNKDDEILAELNDTSKTLFNNYKPMMETFSLNGKPVYTIKKDNLKDLLFIKLLQRNLSKVFKVKQANRSLISNQLKLLLEWAGPKHIIRTDIKEFYESIPHENLFKKIQQNHILSPQSKKTLGIS